MMAVNEKSEPRTGPGSTRSVNPGVENCYVPHHYRGSGRMGPKRKGGATLDQSGPSFPVRKRRRPQARNGGGLKKVVRNWAHKARSLTEMSSLVRLLVTSFVCAGLSACAIRPSDPTDRPLEILSADFIRPGESIWVTHPRQLVPTISIRNTASGQVTSIAGKVVEPDKSEVIVDAKLLPGLDEMADEVQAFEVTARGGSAEVTRVLRVIADPGVLPPPRMPRQYSPEGPAKDFSKSGVEGASVLANFVIARLQVSGPIVASRSLGVVSYPTFPEGIGFIQFEVTGNFPRYVNESTGRYYVPSKASFVVSEECPSSLAEFKLQ